MDYMTMNFNRNGGSGTSDYSSLSNKPQINDVTLSGNKTSSDLGLMPEYEVDTTPTESSDNLITSGGVWTADKGIKDRLQGSKTAGSTSGTIEIPDYGMTESIDMYFKPTQDLHGYPNPWAGGTGKNKLPLVLADIKALNTSGTWSGNTYTLDGVTYEVLTDSADNVESIGVNGTPTEDSYLALYNDEFASGTYIINGCPSNGSGTTYFLRVRADGATNVDDYGAGASVSIQSSVFCYVQIKARTALNLTFYPMIRLSTESDATFEPYSNICPIEGQDNATFSWTDSHDIENEVSMDFGQTYYGGFCQFSTGAIYSEWDYIASYNGETLSGEWISDRDEYQAGTTPTIGAEVVYKTTPTMAVVRKGDMNLTDDYPMEFNGWLASVTYQPKNTVLLQAKEYTNQKLLSAGLPTPPTTDGTYHLECSVSGGIPTIRWVSNT